VTANQGFMRARSPEHKIQRRGAILAAALDLAAREGVQGVTLGAVATAVGLAKSNVLRYFGTREEIYLGLAAQQWQEWAIDVATRLEEPSGDFGAALAGALTSSLTTRPVFCDLQSVLAATLERHAGLAAVREYKRAAIGALTAVGSRIAAGGVVSEQEGFELAAAAVTFAGMLWPAAHPPEVLRTLYEQEPELARACPPFGPTLERLIRALAAGLPTLRTA
jgi:AcrR family transcriptional regulator